jgi:hypothetical protein
VSLQISRYSHINDYNSGSNLTGHDIDGRPAPEKVSDHLRRNLFRVGAYSFSDHPVVAGHRDDSLMPDLRDGLTLDARQLDRQFLKSPQTTQRLGQAVLPGSGFGHCCLIQGLYHFNGAS